MSPVIRTPNYRYYAAIQSMEARGGTNSLNEFCKEHGVSTALTSTMHKQGWIRQHRGKTKWIYTGPARPTSQQMDEIIAKMRQYAYEHRKDAPSMQKGARKERRLRDQKHQGHRSDLMPFPNGDSAKEIPKDKQKNRQDEHDTVFIDILWGLFTIKKRRTQ